MAQSAVSISSGPNVNTQTSEGISMVRSLFSTCRKSIFCKLPNSVGTPPVRELSYMNSRCIVSESSPISVGIGPVNADSVTEKLPSVERVPRKVGRVPLRPGLISTHNSTVAGKRGKRGKGGDALKQHGLKRAAILLHWISHRVLTDRLHVLHPIKVSFQKAISGVESSKFW
jgi:hypothetical protein